jgi:HD-GYP domain-containing protein (c-di-GMP phosphodiesterase class II)
VVRIPVASLSRCGAIVVPSVVLAGFTAIGQPVSGLLPALIVFLTLWLLHRRLLALLAATRTARKQGLARAEESNQLRARLQVVEEQRRQVDRSLEQARETTAEALARLVALRDPVTGAHVARLAEYTRILAAALRSDPHFGAQLGEAVVGALPVASMLHDVGKVAVPDDLLLKPGPLDADEYAIVKRHTTAGAQALHALLQRDPHNRFLRLAHDIALHHHERWDGSGYPFGLRGESIPGSARIVALADVYDALTSERPYKRAFSHDAARAHLIAQAQAHFDPRVVDAFLKCERDFLCVRAALPDAAPRPEPHAAAATPPPGLDAGASTTPRHATIHPLRPVATA